MSEVEVKGGCGSIMKDRTNATDHNKINPVFRKSLKGFQSVPRRLSKPS